MADLVQISSGFVNDGTSFADSDARTFATGDLLLLVFSCAPASTPVIAEPSIDGWGVTWDPVIDPTAQQFEKVLGFIGTVPAGGSDTLSVDLLNDAASPFTASCQWSLFRVDDAPNTSNGADAIVSTAISGGDSIGLPSFSDPTNTAAAFFWAGWVPAPAGVLGGTLVEIGSRVNAQPGLYHELVFAQGPEEGDDTYSITWAGSFLRRAMAIEFVHEAATGPTISAAFVAPVASFSASVGAEASMSASFAAPEASFSADVDALSSTAAAFVAPAASFSAEVNALSSASASFVAPEASFSASMGVESSAAAAFVAPAASFSASIGAEASMSAAFVAPEAEFSAVVIGDVQINVSAAFVAPAASFSALLGVIVDVEGFSFVAPVASFSARVTTRAAPNVAKARTLTRRVRPFLLVREIP